MKCDRARYLASLRFDGELAPAEAAELDTHVSTCDACAAFVRSSAAIRTELRRDLPPPPPIELPDRRAAGVRRTARPGLRPLGLVAGVVAGLALGLAAGLILSGPSISTAPVTPVVVAAFAERLVAGQLAAEPFGAEVTVTERGWHAEVPERTYRGVIGVLGPDSAVVSYEDLTEYPSDEWIPNDVAVVVDSLGGSLTAGSWCPPELLPGCAREPTTQTVFQRAPFDPEPFVPSDLFVPVWALPEQGDPFERLEKDGQIGLRLTVARVSPLLDALLPGGAWRRFHPADVAEVWVDPSSLMPREILIKPADDPTRSAWAAANRYQDRVGEAILIVALQPTPQPPAIEAITSPFGGGGFRSTGEPAGALAGLDPWRSGNLRGRSVESWAKGAAWLRIDSGPAGGDERVEGSLEVRVGSGWGYLNPGSLTLTLRQDATFFEVTSSLGLEQVVKAVETYGVVGDRLGPEAIPVADVLRLPAGLVRSTVWGDERASTEIGWMGGDSVVRLAQRTGDALTPPVDPAAVGLELRSTVARYSARAGTIEWLEDGRVYTIDGVGVPLSDLVRIAEDLAIPDSAGGSES